MKRAFGFSCLTLILVTLSSPVWACGHGMAHDLDLEPEPSIAKLGKPNPTVIRAEKAFAKGDYRLAIQNAVGAKSTLAKRSTTYKTSKDAVLIRGAKIVAISTIRLGGKVTLDRRAKSSRSKRNASKNISWATSTLEHLAKASKSDPELQTYLAQAYALNPKTRGKALAILTKLAKKDLLVDAHGFATLAQLHKAQKNTVAQKAAQKRCMTISSNNNKLCGVKVQKKASKPVKRFAEQS